MLGAKAVTQLNSVRVSFVNRKENGVSLAKAPAHARVPPWAALRGPRPCAAHVGHVGGPRLRAAGVGRATSSGPRGEV